MENETIHSNDEIYFGNFSGFGSQNVKLAAPALASIMCAGLN